MEPATDQLIQTPVAVTEIQFEAEFFDYEAKYNSTTTQEITPARIDKETYNACMVLSVDIYKKLGCSGFFRADYILHEGELYLIEVNTVPGMSSASLLPQMFSYAKMPIHELLDEEIAELTNREQYSNYIRIQISNSNSMKTILTSTLILMSVILLAQTPGGINYQAVARDGAGILIKNKAIW